MGNRKGVSTLVLIILLIVFAVIGGIITYMFTIAPFIEVPEGTAINITHVYIDKENASSFEIGVLNPSYSPTNATITRIAISLKGESQLYDVVDTDPQIGNGTVLRRGTALNITCYKVLKEGINVPWGEIAGEFSGKTIIVYVFSPDALAANVEEALPNVKLNITNTDFDSKFSFQKFNITVTNPNSELNLTVSEIHTPGIDLNESDVSPQLPKTIAINETVQFSCNGNWHALGNTTLKVFTQEGYVFSKALSLPEVDLEIQNVTFDENNTDHFNVTVFNLPDSANHANVTEIVATLENGTAIQKDYPSVGISQNSTATFMFNWSWKEYRGKDLNITVYFLQDFQTKHSATTPSPIRVKITNENQVFDLSDTGHFNVTIQNHPSSLEAINITQLVANIDGTTEIINGTDSEPQLPYGPIEPGQTVSFYCTVADWAVKVGKNVTLTVYAVTNATSTQYTFDFVFALPTAELNITSILRTTIDDMRYLNVTIENSGYSLGNLAISRVMIFVQNQPEALEQAFPKGQIVVRPGETTVLPIAFNWEAYVGQDITVTVTTDEGVSATWQGNSW